jgi:hypothetical protein
LFPWIKEADANIVTLGIAMLPSADAGLNLVVKG